MRRASAATRVIDLTRQLAEDYSSVPLPEVSRAVREATQGADLAAPAGTTLDGIERRARRRLRQLSAA